MGSWSRNLGYLCFNNASGNSRRTTWESRSRVTSHERAKLRESERGKHARESEAVYKRCMTTQ